MLYSSIQRDRSKLDPRVRKCVLLGYKAGIKGFVMLDINNREIFVYRNVKFYENVFPYFSNYKHNLDTNNNQQFYF